MSCGSAAEEGIPIHFLNGTDGDDYGTLVRQRADRHGADQAGAAARL